MHYQEIIRQIKKDLEKNKDLAYKKGSMSFFKEKIKPIGTRAKDTRKIANSYFQKIKHLPKLEIFSLCETLLETGFMELGSIALSFTFKLKKQFKKTDFKTFEKWLKKFVKNWAHCDDFCTHSVGYLICQYPELASELEKWTRSPNRWLRRAAAVSLIYPVRQKEKNQAVFLQKSLKIARLLLKDRDDLVQKGYGWLLKEAANHHQKQIFTFVLNKKAILPRTALRYAIEKMPEKLKRKAME
ncbi:MAG: DNA alkylation repair protein [Patescibacteria group bacterium]|nr:DNA alkylation repair protein [Patescibacteria group bacterium]